MIGKAKKRLISGIVISLIVLVAGLAFVFHKGKDLKNADEFVKELKARNYTIDSIEDVPKSSAGNAQNGEAAPLAVYISWGDNPYFYRNGKMIVYIVERT